jgi:GH24 family phage-related lysozyme (muramidase)
MRKLNKAGLDLIKEFEGCKLKAYQDSVGVWTIGYGHTKGVKRGDVITQKQAEDIFEDDINIFAPGVEKLIDNDVNDNEFAAMVSLAFNIGLSAFGRSGLLRAVNRGDFGTAANEFLKWNKAGGRVLAGLTRRRKAERALFIKPVKILRAASLDTIQHADSPHLAEPSDNALTAHLNDPTTNEPSDALNAQNSPDSASPQATETTPQQTNEAGATGIQVIQPSALDANPPVSSPFDEPIKILKGKSGNLMNWILGTTGLGGVFAFAKENPWLVVFFFSLVFLGGLAIFLVNHHKKVIEAKTAADPDQYKIQFVKETKSKE